MTEKIATCLSLMRRLPPNKIEQNVSGLVNLVPEETEELLQRIDQPLQESIDKETVLNNTICCYYINFNLIYLGEEIFKM